MNSVLKVARYHLARQPVLFVTIPWAMLVVTLVIDVARGGNVFRNFLFAIAFYFFAVGVQRIGRWLPFGLALGVTRRSFYAGTALLGVSMSLVTGLVIAGLQAIERATGGWELSVTFFRVPHLLDGPWYATWLTSFAGLSLVWVYGMWYGIVNLRWGVLGLLSFVVIQALAVLAFFWSGAGGQVASLSALGQTAVFAALAVVCLAGGHATVRRVTVLERRPPYIPALSTSTSAPDVNGS